MSCSKRDTPAPASPCLSAWLARGAGRGNGASGCVHGCWEQGSDELEADALRLYKALRGCRLIMADILCLPGTLAASTLLVCMKQNCMDSSYKVQPTSQSFRRLSA